MSKFELSEVHEVPCENCIKHKEEISLLKIALSKEEAKLSFQAREMLFEIEKLKFQ